MNDFADAGAVGSRRARAATAGAASSTPLCPSCQKLLQRPEAAFCPACGLEVRHACPLCGSTRRPLAVLTERQMATPWCEACESLLYACCICGRWFPPGTPRCTDPGCDGSVRPVCATHTGRRGDGLGTPSRRLTQFAAAGAPKAYHWGVPSGDVLYAAAVAHGLVYVWVGQSVRALEFSGVIVSEGEVRSVGADVGGRPAPHLPFGDRIAVLGEGLVLARPSGFAWMPVRGNGRPELLTPPGGEPIAQASSTRGWAGWTRRVGARFDEPAALWGARLEASTSRPEARRIELLDAGAVSIAPNSSVAVRDTAVWWLGTDGRLWQADLETGAVASASPPRLLRGGDTAVPRAASVWIDAHGRPGFVASTGVGMQLDAWVAPMRHGEPPRPTAESAGRGPLHGTFVGGGYLVVVGEHIHLLDARDATQSRDGGQIVNLPPGRWVAGCLMAEEVHEGRRNAHSEVYLLVLTDDSLVQGGSHTSVSLAAIDLHTGGVPSVASAELDGLDGPPVGLLAAEASLYVAHHGGVVALTWNSSREPLT